MKTNAGTASQQLALTPELLRNRVRCEAIVCLPAMDVCASIKLVSQAGIEVKATILDPWYNKGVGGVRDDYGTFILDLLRGVGAFSEHLFLWGFPEIVAPFVEKIPAPLSLVAWLTWYYKNNPSVIRGWRSSQNACLHLSRPGARLYPEHFLNASQKRLQREGKLRYMPGPTSVIEKPLLVGFVGRQEQTGHPSQKPVAVFEKLVLMATEEGDVVFDPMCGSGTTGEAALGLGRRALLCDESEEYMRVTQERLGMGHEQGHGRAKGRSAGRALPGRKRAIPQLFET